MAEGPLFEVIEARTLLAGDGVLLPLSTGGPSAPLQAGSAAAADAEWPASDALPDPTSLRVAGVAVNGKPWQSLSSIDPGALGVQTIDVTFTEAVWFTSAAVQVQKVAFSGGVETADDPLPSVVLAGSGTPRMQIAVSGSPCADTWLKVTLRGDGVTGLAGGTLDGDAPAAGSGRGYLYDSSLDLPSGDGAPGGDAVFYVGSLRGCFAALPLEGDYRLTEEDMGEFLGRLDLGDPDTDFRGMGFASDQPDGLVTPADMDGFISIYQSAVSEGRHLDLLPPPIPYAGDTHWSNGRGGGDWSRAGSWGDRGVPHFGDSIVIAAGDTVTVDSGTIWVASGKSVVVGAWATLAISARVGLLAGSTLDCSAPGAKIDNNSSLVGSGTVKLSAASACTGGVNLTAGTWVVEEGATWTFDAPSGLFNPGGDCGSLAINVSAGSLGACHIVPPIRCKSFNLVSGTLVVDEPVTGDVLVLAGGALTYTSGVVNDCYTRFKVKFTGTTGTWNWGPASALAYPAILELPAGAKVTNGLAGQLRTTTLKMAATATLDCNNQAVIVAARTDDFWQVEGMFENVPLPAGLVIRAYANVSSTAAITMPMTGVTFDGTAPRTVRMPRGLTCRLLTVENANANVATVLDMDGGNLTCSAIQLGTAGGTYPGHLILRDGTHTIAGNIAMVGNAASHEITFGGTVTCGGDILLSGITAHFDGVLRMEGGHTLDGASATAITSDGGIVEGVGSPVLIKNMAACEGTLLAVNWEDGGGNESKVVTWTP